MLLWLERFFVANRKIELRADFFCECQRARPFPSETQSWKYTRPDIIASSDSHDILRRGLPYMDHNCVTSVGCINVDDIVEFGLNLVELFASVPLNVPTE